MLLSLTFFLTWFCVCVAVLIIILFCVLLLMKRQEDKKRISVHKKHSLVQKESETEESTYHMK